MFLMAVTLICFTACGQRRGGARGPRQGGHMETGSVLPESGQGMEHMASFDYGYKIAAVRDWLFQQSKQ